MTVEVARSLDLTPFCRTLAILDKRGHVIPFEPNWAQQEVLSTVKADYEASRPSRIIICKGRQLGVSTVSESILFALAVLVENTNSVVVAHDIPSSQYLFGMTKRFYETWPFSDLYPHRYSSKRELTLEEQGSTIQVMTAENPNALRSRTYSAAHCSEVAFWKDPVGAMAALNAGMPPIGGNIQIIESTANGIGNWFEVSWRDAVEKKSEYTPLFFPWWKHYEYIPCQGLECRNGTCEVCTKASGKLRAVGLDERQLLKMGASKAHVAWRRWAVPNRCFGNEDLFEQEFATTSESCFITSGVNAFPEPWLQAVYEPKQASYGNLIVSGGEVKFVGDPSGPVRIYSHPSPDLKWGSYFIGADPSFGAVDGDFSAAHVLNRNNREQVATFHGRMNPVSFADELAKLGKYYNTAMISCETDGGGIATIERLRHLYPRIWQYQQPDRQLGSDRSSVVLSWQTSWKTKAWMIMKLAETIERKKLVLHDKQTYEELRLYTYLGGKGWVDRFGPADPTKGHDDLVMSLAIAIVCESTEPGLEAYEVIQKPQDGVIWPEKQDDEGEAWG